MVNRSTAGGVNFRAPMSRKLQLTTAVFLVLMGCVVVLAPPPVKLASCLLVAGIAAFSVRGYTVQPGVVLVHRLGWATRISLRGLVAIEAEPHATHGSIRVLGNGGAFAFTGKFRNATLGSYRAFVTDPARCVVLVLASQTVVLTPDSPVRFVEAVRRAQL
ncbi:MAG: PH domain-containing protein, partial [Gemmatimonadota bacterium]